MSSFILWASAVKEKVPEQTYRSGTDILHNPNIYFNQSFHGAWRHPEYCRGLI